MRTVTIQTAVEQRLGKRLRLNVSWDEIRFCIEYLWILLQNKTTDDYHYLCFPADEETFMKSIFLIEPGCWYDINIVGCSIFNKKSDVYQVLVGGHKQVEVSENGGEMDIQLDGDKKENERRSIIFQQYDHDDEEENDIRINNTPPDSCTYTVHRASPFDSFDNTLQLIWLHQEKTDINYLVLWEGCKSSITLPVNLIPAMNYSVKLYTADILHDEGIRKLKIKSTFKSLSFCAYMTKAELEELAEKAENKICEKKTTVDYFYRDKSPKYWNDVEKNGGIMKKYIKNRSGDRASVINRNENFEGLFFSSHIDPLTRKPPSHSVFGPRRLFIPTYTIFNEDANLYFADFFCTSKQHKVVLVVTKKGSSTDEFCKQRLLELNKGKNPFLTWSPDRRGAIIPQGVFVEVCYTEDIDVAGLEGSKVAFFQSTRKKGPIRDTSMGIPKPRDCDVCNLKKVIDFEENH